MIDLQVYNAIKQSWSKKTCYPWAKDKWSRTNAALWQCAITALLLHEFYWGEILYNKQHNHYWNRINWKEIDITRSQFTDWTIICIDETRNTDSLFSSPWSITANTKERYDIFKKEVMKLL